MVEKTVFVTEKGKWIFHSLPLSVNIGLSACLYLLRKVLVQCSKYTLNCLDDIMVFLKTWESHLMHLKEVFKGLKDADFKIKCSKCEFFKSKAHYLGYLVGADGVQPLPEKVTAIEALDPPQNIKELWHFLGLIGFYRKFIPFFADIIAFPNDMLRKGVVFKWTEWCNKAFNLLKSELVKLLRLQYPNLNKIFKLFTDVSKQSYSGVLHQEEVPNKVNTAPKLVSITYFLSSFSNM